MKLIQKSVILAISLMVYSCVNAGKSSVLELSNKPQHKGKCVKNRILINNDISDQSLSKGIPPKNQKHNGNLKKERRSLMDILTAGPNKDENQQISVKKAAKFKIKTLQSRIEPENTADPELKKEKSDLSNDKSLPEDITKTSNFEGIIKGESIKIGTCNSFNPTLTQI